MAASGSENLLAGLGKCHPGKGRGQGFRVHLAASALQVIILPRLSVRRLKHQPTRLYVINPQNNLDSLTNSSRDKIIITNLIKIEIKYKHVPDI